MSKMTYEELGEVSSDVNIATLEKEFENQKVETPQSMITKIRQAHNLGFNKGYKMAMDKYAIVNTDVKEILGYDKQ